MNERPFRVWPTAAATILIAGLLTLMFPWQAPSIVQIVLVTFAALAGLYALSAIAPAGSVAGRWSSPFDQAPRGRHEEPRSDELETIRARIASRRVVIPGAGPLPPETLRMLQRLISSALHRVGMDPDDDLGLALARERLQPLTWAILHADPPTAPGWSLRRWAAPAKVSHLVRRVLDDLDRLETASSTTSRSLTSRSPGAS